MMVTRLFILVLASSLFACGADLSKYTKIRPLPIIVKATEAELTAGTVVPMSYIVAFKNNLPNGGLGMVNYFTEYQAHYKPLRDQYFSDLAIKDIHYITSLDLSGKRPIGEEPQFAAPPSLQLGWQGSGDDGSNQAASIARIDFTDNDEAIKLLEAWKEQGKIWYAEPNYRSQLNSQENSFADFAKAYDVMITTENAPWFDKIGLVGALSSMGDIPLEDVDPPIIAIMDSGVDYEHPALVANMWKNDDAYVNRAGCQNDVYGCNTTRYTKGSLGNGEVWPNLTSGPGEDCPNPSDPSQRERFAACFHGTHVAGLVAARPQVGYGGSCPVCKIISIRVVGKTFRGDQRESSFASIDDSSIIAGFAYLSRFKKNSSLAVRVVNASFGKFQRARTVEILIRLLRSEGKGTLVVAAAGNEDTMERQYPAAFSDVIAVANVSAVTGIKHYTSNFGPWVSLSAPGSYQNCYSDTGGIPDGIRSAVPGGSNYCAPGTSMASPIVAGIAGLLLIRNPNFSYDDIRSRLLNTSDPLFYRQPENTAYFPKVENDPIPIPLLGEGIVNAANAIANTEPEGRIPQRFIERVSEPCGVIGVGGTRSAEVSLLFLLLPCLVIIVLGRSRRQVRRIYG